VFSFLSSSGSPFTVAQEASRRLPGVFRIRVDLAQPLGIEFMDLAEFIEARLKERIDLVSRKGIKSEYLKEIESGIIYV
jgi:hypothetical protein